MKKLLIMTALSTFFATKAQAIKIESEYFGPIEVEIQRSGIATPYAQRESLGNFQGKSSVSILKSLEDERKHCQAVPQADRGLWFVTYPHDITKRASIHLTPEGSNKSWLYLGNATDEFLQEIDEGVLKISRDGTGRFEKAMTRK